MKKWRKSDGKIVKLTANLDDYGCFEIARDRECADLAGDLSERREESRIKGEGIVDSWMF